MQVEDNFANGKRWWVRLHEKGGKRHEMPAHHKLEQFLDEYLAAAGIGDHDKSPLFRSVAGRTGMLTERPIHRVDAYGMVRRRTAEAGLKGKLGCHVFRATGITAYLEAGGTLENAQAMAAHESPTHDQALRSHRRRDHAGRDRTHYDLTSKGRRWVTLAPTRAVGGLLRVDTCPRHPGFPPSAIRSLNGPSSTLPRFRA